MKRVTGFGSKLTIEAMKYEDENIAKIIFDLKSHKGERIRVHIDMDGKYTVKTNSRQRLLVCELDIPTRKYAHTESVVNGVPVTESSEVELELEKVVMKEYLKEVITK